jgi:hypothetical protein
MRWPASETRRVEEEVLADVVPGALKAADEAVAALELGLVRK